MLLVMVTAFLGLVLVDRMSAGFGQELSEPELRITDPQMAACACC